MPTRGAATEKNQKYFHGNEISEIGEIHFANNATAVTYDATQLFALQCFTCLAFDCAMHTLQSAALPPSVNVCLFVGLSECNIDLSLIYHGHLDLVAWILTATTN